MYYKSIVLIVKFEIVQFQFILLMIFVIMIKINKLFQRMQYFDLSCCTSFFMFCF